MQEIFAFYESGFFNDDSFRYHKNLNEVKVFGYLNGKVDHIRSSPYKISGEVLFTDVMVGFYQYVDLSFSRIYIINNLQIKLVYQNILFVIRILNISRGFKKQVQVFVSKVIKRPPCRVFRFSNDFSLFFFLFL